jgi:hypothetical protein
MPHHLISLDDRATTIPEEDLPNPVRAVHESSTLGSHATPKSGRRILAPHGVGRHPAVAR